MSSIKIDNYLEATADFGKIEDYIVDTWEHYTKHHTQGECEWIVMVMGHIHSDLIELATFKADNQKLKGETE